MDINTNSKKKFKVIDLTLDEEINLVKLKEEACV